MPLRYAPGPSLVVAALAGVGDAVGALADFLGGLAGRRHGLLGGGGSALARRAADDVAEGVLEALGAAVRTEALDRLLLLLRVALAVVSPPPGCPRLAEPHSALEGDGDEEKPDDAVQQPLLGEAEGDEAADDDGADDAADHLG